jgi:hypothetical protein
MIGNADGSWTTLEPDDVPGAHMTKHQLEALPLAKQLEITRPVFEGFVDSLTRSLNTAFTELSRMTEQLERVAHERGWIVEPATATAFAWREGRRREARPREHRSGRGHSRRGPPNDDDPHEQPLSALVAAAGSDEAGSDTPQVTIHQDGPTSKWCGSSAVSCSVMSLAFTGI